MHACGARRAPSPASPGAAVAPAPPSLLPPPGPRSPCAAPPLLPRPLGPSLLPPPAGGCLQAVLCARAVRCSHAVPLCGGRCGTPLARVCNCACARRAVVPVPARAGLQCCSAARWGTSGSRDGLGSVCICGPCETAGMLLWVCGTCRGCWWLVWDVGCWWLVWDVSGLLMALICWGRFLWLRYGNGFIVRACGVLFRQCIATAGVWAVDIGVAIGHSLRRHMPWWFVC